MSEFLNRMQTWDDQLILSIISFRSRNLTFFMKIMSSAGDGYIYVLAALAIYMLQGISIDWLTFTVLAFAFELGFYKLIKSGTSRPRPYQANPGIINLVIPPDQFSFPSGHTAAATVSAVAFSLIFPALIPVFILFAFLVGTSRVYLGVHYPTDIAAGLILGLASCGFSYLTMMAF